MTDVEDLLIRDGAAWRAAQPPPVEFDPARLGQRPRRWQPLAAAAAVVLLAGGGITTLALAREPIAAPATGSGAPPAADPYARPSTWDRAPGTQPAPEDLTGNLVQDGDRVSATGSVVAVPGQPVRLCAPHIPWRDTRDCETGVTLIGIDLARLADRRQVPGRLSGSARVEGRYTGGTITVDRQLPPDSAPQGWGPPDFAVACPAPAGGWRGRTPGGARGAAFMAALQGAPDEFLPFYWSVPDAEVAGGGTVPAIGTVLPLAEARARLEAAWGGDVCVFPARHPASNGARIQERMDPWRAAGSGGDGPLLHTGLDMTRGYVTAGTLVVDRATLTLLREYDRGEGAVSVYPIVRPLG